MTGGMERAVGRLTETMGKLLTKEECEYAAHIVLETATPIHNAFRDLYAWYDKDGSVGAASDIFEKHRALLGSIP